MYNRIALAGYTLSIPLPAHEELGSGWTRLDVLCNVPQERHPDPLPPHIFIKGWRGDRNPELFPILPILTELEDSDLCNLDKSLEEDQ